MNRYIIISFLLFISLLVNAQEKINTKQPKLVDAKSQMVLRGNTRDQVSIMKNNVHRNQIIKRKQGAINRQQMMNKKRMHQIQKNKMMKQQRNIQKRRMRHQASRQQRMRNR